MIENTDRLLSYAFSFADSGFLYTAFLFVLGFANTFLPPIPVEITTIFAGYMISLGHGSFFQVVSAALAGMSLGSLAVYLLANKYGPSVFQKGPLKRLFDQGYVEKLAGWYDRYGIAAMFAAKFVPGMSICSVIFAGSLKMRFRKAVLGIVGSNLVFFSALAYAGKAAGDNWRSVQSVFDKAGLALLIFLLVSLVPFWLYFKIKKRGRG